MAIAVVFICLLMKTTLVKAAGSAISDKSSGDWTVTRYGATYAEDYLHHMFYTVKNKSGHLIVIDGGWDKNQKYVRQVIKKNGGVVDLWIVTHPHPDHAGAFLKIAQKPNGIKIKKVVTTKIPRTVYKDPSFFGYDIWKNLNKCLKNMTVRYVKTGDRLSFYGLSIRFYNSYGSEMKAFTDRWICNQYSLAFMLKGKSHSMFFAGDMNMGAAMYVASKYGTKLKADYLQMPHHGLYTK